LQSAFNRYEPLKDIEIEYNRGWAEDEAFEDILIRSETTDRLQGYTSSGAHKADLSIGIGKIKARDKLSRGQTKLLVYALKLAQGELFKKLTGKKCIYILDDLPSELDEINKMLVFEHLADLDCQFFVTGVDKSDFLSHLPKKTCKMFHVEQGNITECNY
jgi:DNA replication and repair protein RecF